MINTPLWTENIRKMINEFKGPVIPIRGELPKNTKSLGKVPEDLQKLLSLSVRFNVESEKLLLEKNFKDGDELVKDLAKAEHLHSTSRLLRKIFWLSLEDHLGITEHDKNLGLAKDWQVYARESEIFSLEDLLTSMGSAN